MLVVVAHIRFLRIKALAVLVAGVITIQLEL
jgi:hypothetical protein